MKGIHPKSIAAAVVALALLSAAGCRNPSGGVANPFLAPNRVPAPSTRALLPGEAQPYYPGDPLPVMQSQNGAAAENTALAATDPQIPSASENLKWGAPKTAPQAIAVAAPAQQPQPQAIAATTQPTTASAEPSVAIPSDGDDLRFATQPAPEPQQLTPPAAAPIAAQTAPAANQVATSAPQQPVVPASYSAPTLASSEPVTSPWRTPQLTQPTIAPQPSPQSLMIQQQLPPPPMTLAAPPLWPAAPVTPSPNVVASNVMDVRMRAVPSPAIDGYSPTPRIRMPGSGATEYVGSNDGFRPRSSMR
jgi:hypothetical protein